MIPNSKNTQGYISLFMKISLIMLLLFNFTITPLQVLAKEDDGGEKTEETEDKDGDKEDKEEGDEDSKESSGGSTSNGSANVFDSIDDSRKQVLLNRLKYDMRLHYIITYAILNDDYMADGLYSNLVNRGSFPEGFNENIKMEQFTTGATNIVTTTELSKDASEKENDDEKIEEIKDSSKEREEVTNKLVDKYLEDFLLLHFRTLYTPKVFYDYMGGVAHISVKHTNSKSISLKGIKSTKLYKLTESQMKGRLYTFFYGLSTDDIKKIQAGEYPTESLYKKAFPTNEETKEIANKTIPKGINHESFKKGIIDLTTKDSTQIKYSFLNDEVELFFKLIPGMYASWKGDDDSKKAKSFLESRVKNNDTVKKSYDSIVKKLKEDKDLDKLIKLNEGDSELLESALSNDTIKGIGWLPLRIKYGKDLEELENGWFKDSEFRQVIEFFDGGIVNTEGTVEVADKSKYKGFRLLQVNDLINIPVKKTSTGVKTSHLRASPYLVFEWEKWLQEKDENKQLKVSYGDIMFTNDIIKYTGIRYDEAEAPETATEYVVNLFKSKKDKVGHTKSATTADVLDLNRVSHRAFTLGNSDGKRTDGLTKLGDMTIGIDSYGNIISSETMKVMIPYWANTNIYGIDVNLKGDKEYLTIPVLKKLTSAEEKSNTFHKKLNKTELSVKLNQKDLEEIGEITHLEELNGILTQADSERNNIETYLNILNGDKKSKQAVALALTQDTTGIIKAFNAQFLNNAEAESELYITPSDAGALGGNIEEDELGKFNALELLEKIKLILDIGFYELIRLTIASWVVTFYTSSVSNFSMANVFHTELIVDTPYWSEMLTSIALLLVGFTGLYIAIMGIKVMRQTATMQQLFKTLISLMLVLLIPVVIYSPLVNWVVNKPSQVILNKQMQQVSMVDSYINVQNEISEVDPLYSKLFGHKQNLVEKDDQYLIDFYTTEHVKGFDILDYNPDRESRLSRFIRNNLNRDSDWGKNELVKVRVRMFDLFEWVEGDNGDLFGWLASSKGSDYPDLAQYTEYSVDTSLTYEGLDFDFVGREWKASEIFRAIYKNMETEQVQNNISGLYNLTSAFRTRASTDNSGGLSNKEREFLIRDLAFASTVRNDIYGSNSAVSSKTQQIFDKYSISKETINLEQDFLALEKIIPEFKPYRDITTTTLAGDVYDINKAILDDYILNLSIVRESANADEATYGRAEYPMIVMRTWFEFNKSLGNKFLPTNYGVDTITFDTYMRLLYIPLGQYFQVDTPDIKNVSEYLSLREHPLTLLFLFLPLILSLMLYGLIYVGIFYVVLMVAMMASFIYNNVIKSNPENKSLVGALIIIVTMGISKLGLVIIWSLLATLLNFMFANTGSVSYPVALIHSLVTFAYVLLNLIFIWKFIILNILKDKGNLGGQAMLDSMKSFATNVKAKFTGTVTGSNPLASNMPGSFDAQKLREGANSSLSTMGRGIGQAGKLSTTALANKGVRDAVINSRATGIAKNIAESLAGQAVNGYHNIADSAYKVINKDGKEEELTRNTADLLIDASSDDRTVEVNRAMLQEYDSIKPKEFVGLTEEEQNVLEENESYGMDLTRMSENYSIVDTENEQSAEIMAKYLREEKGLNATVDGSKVVFNHDEYELDTSEGRKALFGGLVQNSAKELAYLQSSYVAVKDDEALPYTTTKDGDVEINVGSDGLSNQGLDEILENPSIAENFIVSSLPEKTVNGYANGSLVLTPRNKGVEVHDSVNDLFNLDGTVRKKNNIESRKPSNLDTMVDIGEADKETLAYVNENKLNGMSVQNGKLYYDSRDSQHTEFATELTNQLNENVNDQRTMHKDLAVKVASHVTHGEGSGMETKVYNSSEIQKDKNLVNQFHNYGHDVVKPVEQMSYFGGKHSETIEKRVKDTIAYNKLDSEISSKLVSTQQFLAEKGYEVVKQSVKTHENMTGVAQDKATLNRLTNLAEKNNLQIDTVDSARKELIKIEQERKSNGITESEYEAKVSTLLDKTRKKLSSDDRYVDVMSNVLRDSVSKGKVDKQSSEKIKEVLDTYVDVSRELVKHGVSDIGSSVQLYNDMNLDKHGIDFSKVKDVYISKDGKVHVETDGTVDKTSLDNFIMDISKSVSEIEKE